MIRYSYPLEMEISGNTAMWTRPDTGDSPCSYPAPTYSAVKAIFESVLWGPVVKIIPRRVEICTPIQYHSYTTNYTGPLRDKNSIKDGGNYQLYATVLVNVCYKLYADVVIAPNKRELPEKATTWNGKTTSPGHAYQDIFNRRLIRGQSYASLALGWREFTPSYFGPLRDETKVFSDMHEILIPSMLREVFPYNYRSAYRAIYDTNVVIRNGVLVYPERMDAL